MGTPSSGTAPASEPEPMLTTEEVGKRLGVTPTTVLRYVRAKRLPAYRLGHRVTRFRADDVARFIEQNRR